MRINGRDGTVLVALPFRARVGEFLRVGRNTIEIEVTNTSANRIRDLDRRGVPWRIMKDADIVTPNYTPFDASSWPIQPAGLLGPVTLTPLRVRDL